MTHPANLSESVVWARAADKQLRNLTPKDAEDIKMAVLKLAQRDEGDMKKLKGGGPFRLRVGSFRVFFDVRGRPPQVGWSGG